MSFKNLTYAGGPTAHPSLSPLSSCYPLYSLSQFVSGHVALTSFVSCRGPFGSRRNPNNEQTSSRLQGRMQHRLDGVQALCDKLKQSKVAPIATSTCAGNRALHRQVPPGKARSRTRRQDGNSTQDARCKG